MQWAEGLVAFVYRLGYAVNYMDYVADGGVPLMSGMYR